MLSKKAQYALKAVGYLTERYKGVPVQIYEIADKKKIPLKFLEAILLDLKKAGILGSKKGKGGGYFLDQDPETVSLAKVIRLVDGPISMLPCVSIYFYEKCSDCEETVCPLNKIFIEARDATLSILDHKSLKELCVPIE